MDNLHPPEQSRLLGWRCVREIVATGAAPAAALGLPVPLAGAQTCWEPHGGALPGGMLELGHILSVYRLHRQQS